MYRLTDKKNGTYGVFDTSDNTITYLTFNDLIKAYSHTDIEGMAKMLMGYKARMVLLGVDVTIFEKTDTKETAREKVKAMQPKPYKVFNFSDITNMSEMFTYCKATELDLSNFDTSKVTNMKGMFDSCKITKLDLSNFDTAKVEAMRGMFRNCETTKLDLSSFNTSKVIDMKYMFEWCYATELDLSNFDTSNVTDMSRMFYNHKIENIIPPKNTSTRQKIGLVLRSNYNV